MPVTKACALKFGESATTTLEVFRGCVFMVTSLNVDRVVDEVMGGRAILEESSQSQSQSKC